MRSAWTKEDDLVDVIIETKFGKHRTDGDLGEIEEQGGQGRHDSKRLQAPSPAQAWWRKVGIVVVLCNRLFRVEQSKCHEYATFESTGALIASRTKEGQLLMIYRPPSSSVSACLLNDFTRLTGILLLEVVTLLVAGEFNIRSGDSGSARSQHLSDLLASSWLTQKV